MPLPSVLALALILPVVGAEAASVKVEFLATSDQFSAEPFATGSVVAGEFIVDLDAPILAPPACPIGSRCLDGALRNAQFTVDGLVFTADRVDVQFTRLSGGTLLSVVARTEPGQGKVSGAVPSKGLTLVGAEFEARFASTFFPLGLEELRLGHDFTLLVGRLFLAPFGSAGPLTTFTLEQGEFRSLVVSDVPLPAATWLFASSLTALGAPRRRAAPLAS